MKKECTNCENENLMRVAELELENAQLKNGLIQKTLFREGEE